MRRELGREAVEAMAALAGYRLEPDAAERIARAVGPALCAFSGVEATLPFEAEPSGFLIVQIRGDQAS